MTKGSLLCALSLLFFQCSEREYVPRNSDGEERHQQLCPPPLIDHRKDAVAYCEPHHRYRYNLYTQRYGTIFSEIADILAKDFVI